MAMDKEEYFKTAAKGLTASTKLYKVDSIVHVEDEDDIWFWEQLLSKYRPGRYKFKPATTNEKGQLTKGCAQCLKYKNYLSQRFFICIDSDLRYLFNEDISAVDGILQTYTYSWENHCAFASILQESFEKCVHKEFNFEIFLLEYSKVVYKPFLLMLYLMKNALPGFGSESFKQCISIQYKKGDELDNGKSFLVRLAVRLDETTKDIIDSCGFDLAKESSFYAVLGLREENAYLYIRGHCLYNSLVSLGMKLCENTGVDFEQNVLKSTLAFDKYNEISRIKTDICLLNTIRKEMY